MATSFTEYRAAGGVNSRVNQKKELKRLEKVIENAEIGGALSNATSSWSKWLHDNTGVKLLPNGKKQTVWKTGESAGKPFNEKIGKDQWRMKYYGTLTPYQDRKYLRQLDKNETRLDRLRRNKLRIGASEKDWEGTPIHLLKVDQLETRLNKEAEELRAASSYADFEVPVSKRNKEKEDEQPPIDKFADFEEKAAHEWDGEQPSNSVQRELAEGGGTPQYQQNRNKLNESRNNTSGLEGETWNSDQDVNYNRVWNDSGEMTNRTKSSDNVGPARLTGREALRAANVDRHGEWHVSKLEERHGAWKDAKKSGNMDQFRQDYSENLGAYLRSERAKLKIDPKKKKKVA